MEDDAALAAALETDDGTTAATGDWESVQRRRRLLDALESGPGETTVSELVDALAADDAEPLDGGPLRVRLVHVDLPRLEDAGSVAYDRRRESVRLIDDRERRSIASDGA